ncbi:hypothetical protein E1B28_011824 [Marasmius oreades]|uniref:Uncharacterized protein n=1 Tax=Marasmius oreades TaxID=181124 RepID=A0A9P7RUY1_9AGAR|nr:uncharacterized protein E1B28_011824 [Marasmius oreades]KAG7090224.1 hypothetical protein E1B28_011824 [Marasmius oreades]
MVENVLTDDLQSRNLLESKGEDAQMWLDSLQMLINMPDVEPDLRPSIITMMIYLSKRSGLFPRYLIINNVKRLEDPRIG